MILNFTNGYPDYIGYRQAFCGWGNGPASYVAGGDPTTLQNSRRMIDVLFGGMLSLSGNYIVDAIPSATGERQTWYAVWRYANGGAAGLAVTDVTSSGGSGMTAGTYNLTFSGGGGSGAAGTVTVSTSAVTAIKITNGGAGYTTPPSVSAATGGTPPTLTAVLGSAVGSQVVAGTNLSGETVQMGGFCGQW